MSGLQAPSSGVRFAVAFFLFPTKEPGPAASFTSKVAMSSEAARFSSQPDRGQLAMSDSRHTEDYPLKPTDADLDDESLDAQEDSGLSPVSVRGWTPADDAEIAALRFNLREWQDRARDMERERDEMRLHMLHELLATLDRDFAQAIAPADAWSEALIRVGALERRAEQEVIRAEHAEAGLSLLNADRERAERRAEQAERGRVAAELASGRAARDVMFDAIRRANSDEHEAVPDSCVECGVIIGGEHECATASPYIERLTARAEQAEAELAKADAGYGRVFKRMTQAEAALREVRRFFEDEDHCAQVIDRVLALAATTPGEPQHTHDENGTPVDCMACFMEATTPGEPLGEHAACTHDENGVDIGYHCPRCGGPTSSQGHTCATTPGEPTMPPLETRADWYAAPAASTADLDRADHDGRQA